MTADILSIVPNPQASKPILLDVVQCLRNLAQNIEDGVYVDVARVALVMRCNGQEPVVFGMGQIDIPQTYMDLHAGAQQLMSMENPGRVT